jgi:hypothetical protein
MSPGIVRLGDHPTWVIRSSKRHHGEGRHSPISVCSLKRRRRGGAYWEEGGGEAGGEGLPVRVVKSEARGRRAAAG